MEPNEVNKLKDELDWYKSRLKAVYKILENVYIGMPYNSNPKAAYNHEITIEGCKDINIPLGINDVVILETDGKTLTVKPRIKQPCDIITVEFLQSKHPHLTKWQAEDLLKFCKERTITHTQCYGDGSIMYPKWVKEWEMDIRISKD
jgi:hypothetical protein